MQTTDVKAVMYIEADSFPTSWSAAGYLHELTANQQAHYVVLEAEGDDGSAAEAELIGYAGHWLVAGEAHISTIAVAPSWRGRGLGALLLLWMIYHAIDHDASVVSLEVREHNSVAQELYTDYGFHTVGRRRGYYRDTGEDALLMDLDLTQPAIREALEAKRQALWIRLQGALR